MDILEYFRKSVDDRKDALERGLKETKEDIRALKWVKDPLEVIYKVKLYDGWPGEKEVELSAKGSLERAIRNATNKYKRINRRSDVQARCSVMAIIPTPRRIALLVPKEEWIVLFEEYGTYKPK